MIKRSEKHSGESRANLRIRENRRISWELKNGDQKGIGRVRNISTTGMLFETNTKTQPHDQTLYSFDSRLGHNNFIPQRGQLIWHKKKNFARDSYLCGIRFIEPAEFELSRLNQRVDKRMAQVAIRHGVNQLASAILTLVIFVLMGYVVWQSSEIYQGMNAANQSMFTAVDQQASLFRGSELKVTSLTEELNSTKLLYQESEGMLLSVSKELETTKAILLQTENMLTEARSSNARLKQEVQALSAFNETQSDKTRVELDNMVVLLQGKNLQLQNEIKTLQDSLKTFSGEVTDVLKGRAALNFYRSKIRTVKDKIKYFKREAHNAKIAALLEKDRIKSMLGNNGYFVKDGQDVIVDFAQYESIQIRTVETSPTKRKVEIDVTFVD